MPCLMMQVEDKPWTCSVGDELQNWLIQIQYNKTFANELYIYVLQGCQGLYKPGNGLIFTVTLGTVILSINSVSFPFWSCSRIGLLMTSTRQSWLSLSFEETYSFLQLNFEPSTISRNSTISVSDELFWLLCVWNQFSVLCILILKATWKVFSILHHHFCAAKTNTLIFWPITPFIISIQSDFESLHSIMPCVFFLRCLLPISICSVAPHSCRQYN